MKRKKYFDEERALEFIWQNADRDGIWHGDAASLAIECDVSKEVAEAVLDDLRTRRFIEKLYTGKYIIVNWRDRDEINQEHQAIVIS
jgi:hypothetical protein